MVGPDDPALQDGEVGLDGVGMNEAAAAYILADPVVDRAMAGEALGRGRIDLGFVRHDVRRRVDLRL